MCEPTLLAAASFAVTAGSAVAGASSQNKASKANKAAAAQALSSTLTGLNIRSTQEKDAAAQTLMEADRTAREADALARVSAGEAGVAGASVDALLGSIAADKGSAAVATQRNLANTLQQIEAEKKGAYAGAQSRSNAIPGMNPFLTGLQIGGAGVDLATSIYRTKNPIPGKT